VDHVHRVPVLRVQVDLAHRVQVLLVQVDHVQPVAQDLVLRVQVASVLRQQLQRVVQDLAVVVAAVLELLVRLVRVAARARLESQSAPREKSLSKDRLRASVVQLYQEAMATQWFVFAAVHRFKTSLTRSAQTPAS
jgi:hypothetical protein